MSSRLGNNFKDGSWIDSQMIIEFRSWIKDSIQWRMKMMNYGDMTPALRRCLG